MYYMGIDIGGTNIAAGITNEKGVILAKSSTPTLSCRSAEEITADISELSVKLTQNMGLDISDISCIGIGCPGIVDNKSGKIVYCSNIPFINTPIRDVLSQTFANAKISLINDADAAAYGEYMINGNNCESFILVTLGTGVGGGVILNRKLYTGFNGIGSELGHMTLVSGGILCNCGKRGCWEKYASVTALKNQTREAIEAHPESAMNKWVAEHGKISGRTAFECAKSGDKAAKEVVRKYTEYIADGIVSISNIFEPQKIMIGGGISKEGDYLLDPIRQYAEKYDYNKYMPRTSIEAAKLFNDAGIIGAALYAAE